MSFCELNLSKSLPGHYCEELRNSVYQLLVSFERFMYMGGINHNAVEKRDFSIDILKFLAVLLLPSQ